MTENFKTTSTFGFGPAIMDYFASIPEGAFSYNYYHLRHPGGIYNLVINRLITDIIILDDKIKNYDEQRDDIYPYFRIVLYDLFKFYDSCFEIMLCFAPVHDDRPETFTDRWLKNKGYSYAKDFIDATANNLEVRFSKKLYNNLKHTSNEIRFLTVNNPESTGFGYWLEVAGGDGGVECENSQDYPISIAREIRRIQYIIYKLSDVLFEVLKPHIKTYFPQENYTVPLKDTEDSFFLQLLDTINKSPEFFLLNEKNKVFYKANMVEKDGCNFIEFSKNYIKNEALNKYFAPPVSGGFINSSDGYTRKFSMPHMGVITDKSDWEFTDKTQYPPKLL